jgi:hypothetical protein
MTEVAVILFIILTVAVNYADYLGLTGGAFGWCDEWHEYLAQYLTNVFVTLSQALNTIWFGVPDETLSSRVGRSVYKGGVWVVLYYIIGAWFFWARFDFHHCRRRVVG